MLLFCLQTIENILDESRSVFEFNEPEQNPFLMRFAHANGVVLLEKLQQHSDNEIYKIVFRIIDNHFDYYEEK